MLDLSPGDHRVGNRNHEHGQWGSREGGGSGEVDPLFKHADGYEAKCNVFCGYCLNGRSDGHNFRDLKNHERGWRLMH